MSLQQHDQWSEPKRRCRLSEEEVRMAKALGFQPKSLIKNIPSPSQPWKAPVNEWVRSLYEKKFGLAVSAASGPPPQPAKPATVIEFRDPDHPWPDKPEIPELVVTFDEDEFSLDYDEFVRQHDSEPPSSEEIDEENTRMLRRQCLYRWAAQSIAVAMSRLREVRKVAAFGSVSQPLEMEVPRFRKYRRNSVDIYHECRDLDLAVWTADLSRLHELKRALHRGLSLVQDTEYGGVAHHQVDVHIFESATGAYRGRLCIFGQCPKPGKRECRVPGCGAEPFLQQFAGYRFDQRRFEAEPKVVLFDRASGFLVRPPRIDAKPARIVYTNITGEDVPF